MTQCLDSVKPYVSVRVEEYSEDEMMTVLNYYTHTKWLVSGDINIQMGFIPQV